MTDPQGEASAEIPVPRVIKSEELLQGSRQVWIDHRGERYRLVLTKNGRLILQK